MVGTGSTAFGLSGGIVDLAPGESFDLTVTFTPQSFMDYEIQLVVASNDPDEPKAKADAIGHGSEYAMNEEIFKQPDVQAVDVLWVVDNSGSMSSVVETLGDKFESFLESFSALGIDYQIGVTSTDMDDPTHQGRLLGRTPSSRQMMQTLWPPSSKPRTWDSMVRRTKRVWMQRMQHSQNRYCPQRQMV